MAQAAQCCEQTENRCHHCSLTDALQAAIVMHAKRVIKHSAPGLHHCTWLMTWMMLSRRVWVAGSLLVVKSHRSKHLHGGIVNCGSVKAQCCMLTCCNEQCWLEMSMWTGLCFYTFLRKFAQVVVSALCGGAMHVLCLGRSGVEV